jgi:hypothetical protein
MHHGPQWNGRVETAAHAKIQRQVVVALCQQPRGPGGSGDHAYSGREHVDVMRAVPAGRQACVATRRLLQRREQRSDLRRSRGDDEHAHDGLLLFLSVVNPADQVTDVGVRRPVFLRRDVVDHLLMRRPAVWRPSIFQIVLFGEELDAWSLAVNVESCSGD